MQRRNSTTSLVEASIMAAIVVVLMLMAAYVPVLGTLSTFILPIPITILVIRNDFRIALVSLVASTILSAMFLDPINAVSVLVLYGAVGLSLGFSIKRKNKAVLSVAIQAAAAVVGLVISTAMYIYLLLGSNIRVMLQSTLDMMNESINTSINMYSNMGVAVDFSKLTEYMSVMTVDTMLRLLAPIVVIYAFIIAFINYNITRQVFRKMKIDIPSLPPFANWYLDNRITATMILLVCIGVILSSSGFGVGSYLYIGSMYLIQVVFMLLGLCAVTYFLKKLLLPKKSFRGDKS